MNITRIAVVLILVSTACSAPLKNRPIDGRVDLQGHRGARGLRPENTIISFLEALKHNMTTIELDTTLTKDDQLIIHHDVVTNPELCQTKAGNSIASRVIREMTVSELKEFDCGSKLNPRFPDQKLSPGEPLVTLPEFFDFVKAYDEKYPNKERVKFNIEIKVSEQPNVDVWNRSAEAMLTAINNANMNKRTTVQSFEMAVLFAVRRLDKEITISALFAPTGMDIFMSIFGTNYNGDMILEMTKQIGAQVVSPHEIMVTPSFIANAHEQNTKVIPWTINDEARMRELIEDGVDGIITDYPDMLAYVNQNVSPPK